MDENVLVCHGHKIENWLCGLLNGLDKDNYYKPMYHVMHFLLILIYEESGNGLSMYFVQMFAEQLCKYHYMRQQVVVLEELVMRQLCLLLGEPEVEVE